MSTAERWGVCSLVPHGPQGTSWPGLIHERHPSTRWAKKEQHQKAISEQHPPLSRLEPKGWDSEKRQRSPLLCDLTIRPGWGGELEKLRCSLQKPHANLRTFQSTGVCIHVNSVTGLTLGAENPKIHKPGADPGTLTPYVMESTLKATDSCTYRPDAGGHGVGAREASCPRAPLSNTRSQGSLGNG